MKSKRGLDMLERVRAICASLPEVEEIVDGFGHDVMKVRGKTFIMMGFAAPKRLVKQVLESGQGGGDE